ncbi:EfeM/EfeO family lipoprotein [Arthrobacter sp.]|uniref:EfeM/EfeO family lipoprotein n=1 Tax=Arthrobacter sp. TaxID=1667 RepID=UPI0026DF7E8D|nr:EfeM/EfeO family lipoprotein [Arthrobacter sp.]MDO5753726.1 EfeM/EfeO family lipoprotein [Arthrobacter sp.]
MTTTLPAPEPTMAAVITAYRTYLSGVLDTISSQALTLKASIGNNDLDAARTQWLATQLSWQRVGAAYGSFGKLGEAINGLPAGLPKGAADPAFTGLHRIEYGLFHGQGPAELVAITAALHDNVTSLHAELPTLDIAGMDMAIRSHEILEDSLRDNLSGHNDQGSGMALALTFADLDGTRVVLALMRTVVDGLHPGYTATVSATLDRLGTALNATKLDGTWPVWDTLPLPDRQTVTGAIGASLEALAYIPALFSTDDD